MLLNYKVKDTKEQYIAPCTNS